jgi:carboxyl-terminal processing protease
VATPRPKGRGRLFDNVVSHIQRNYVDSIPTSVLFEKALAGMLEELGDPHTVYLPPNRLRRLTESTSGLYTGLGVRWDARDGIPTVIAPLPGGPAERAGLLSGYRIVEVEGRATKGWTDEETRNAFRGEAGQQLRLTIDRPGRPTPLPVSITRGEVYRQAVRRSALPRPGISTSRSSPTPRSANCPAPSVHCREDALAGARPVGSRGR